MLRYQFTPACEIGIEELDAEHKELFRLIEKAHNLLENDYMDDKYNHIAEIIAQLKNYANTHFEHEEAYMLSISHPEYEHQKKQHEYFCEKINELDIRGIGEDQEATLDKILTFLLRWLYRHIIGSDCMIGKLKPTEEARRRRTIFSKEYETGILLIDEEHKELFRIISEVEQLISDEYRTDKYDEIIKLLEELKDYASHHFADEEEYMQSIHYKGLNVQKEQHILYIDYISELDLEQMDDDQDQSLQDILDFLTGWLVNHILRLDKKIPVKL